MQPRRLLGPRILRYKRCSMVDALGGRSTQSPLPCPLSYPQPPCSRCSLFEVIKSLKVYIKGNKTLLRIALPVPFRNSPKQLKWIVPIWNSLTSSKNHVHSCCLPSTRWIIPRNGDSSFISDKFQAKIVKAFGEWRWSSYPTSHLPAVSSHHDES